MLIKYEEELSIFLISRGVPEYKYAKFYLIQHCVRKNNVFTYNMVVSEYWLQNHWSDGKHNAKVYGQ